MFDNNAMNYGYGYYGNAPMNGMQYGVVPQRPQMTQPLTDEEMTILTDKGGAFSTRVTREDLFKAYCTHKKNGAIVAFQNPDGSLTCPICGETFNQPSLDKDSVEEKVKAVVDVMQTVKLTYLDISAETARQYFPIIPVLQKLPQLAVMAANNWAKYDGSQQMSAQNASTPYGFAAFNQMVSGQQMPIYGMGYGAQMPANYAYGQPMYQQPMPQAPVYQQQPMAGQAQGYTPNFQQNVYDPNAGMVNPMNTGAYPYAANQNAMPPQAANMMPASGQNEFGTFGNPAYVQNPAVPPQPVVPQANQAATQQNNAQQPVQTAGNPQTDISNFTI